MSLTVAQLTSEYRPYLLSVAYNMTGDMDQAQDIVQDALIKFLLVAEAVPFPKSYLRKMVVNCTIDHLNFLKKHPKGYVGPALATPVEDSFWKDASAEEKTLDQATFLLFDKLTPYERAVLVLKEVYHLRYREIAEIINTEEEYSRKIYSRLKKQLPDLPTKKSVKPEARKAIIQQFLRYLRENDLPRLKSLFKEDIQYYVDSGGKIKGASSRVLQGKDAVSRFILSRLEKITPPDAVYQIKFLNGHPNIVHSHSKKVRLAIQLEITDDQINRIFITANPDKLQYISP